MIKNNLLLIMILAINFVILLTPANAQIIYVDINKTIYYPSDKVTVNVTVINTMPFPVNWSVECGLAIRDGSYPPILFLEPIDLELGEMKTVNFSMDVLETTPSGNYEANIKLLDDSQTLNQASKDFEIRETKREIEASLKSCEDNKCISSKSVFFVGQKIYIVLFSKMSDLTMKGELKTPSKTLDLTFVDRTASATLNEIGSYEALINLSKQGYQDKTKTLQFSVIEEEPDIREEEICVVNQICEDKENTKNCPQDCPSGLSDGYCDKLKDGKCDPDCQIQKDWDCHCGNGICDYRETDENKLSLIMKFTLPYLLEVTIPFVSFVIIAGIEIIVIGLIIKKVKKGRPKKRKI